MEANSNILDIAAKLKSNFEQIPFAMAQAVNRAKNDVQDFETNTQVPTSLTVRTGWIARGTKYGINSTFATKDDPQASVLSRAPWMSAAERGGDLRPKGTYRIIPIIGGARPDAGSIVDKRLKPVKLDQNGTYLQMTRRGTKVRTERAKKGQVRRALGRPKTGKTDQLIPFFMDRFKGVFIQIAGRLKMLFSKTETAHENPRLNFESTGTELGKKKFHEYWPEEFKKACQTAK